MHHAASSGYTSQFVDVLLDLQLGVTCWQLQREMYASKGIGTDNRLLDITFTEQHKLFGQWFGQ